MEPRRRRPPFKGYGIPESEEGMLRWNWAAERLEQARNYWVSTSRPDGRPHAMPVWGIWLDDALERRVDEVYWPKYDLTPDSSGETDPWFVVRPKRAYAWIEREYPASATQFDFD